MVSWIVFQNGKPYYYEAVIVDENLVTFKDGVEVGRKNTKALRASGIIG